MSIESTRIESAGLGRLDHVAIEVPDLDRHVALLVGTGALRLIRLGATRNGQRIALLGDGAGGKIELIEDAGLQGPRFAHVAFRSACVKNALTALAERSWQVKREPHDLAAAQARTALLTDGSGFDLQVISYKPTSPDIVELSADDSGRHEGMSGESSTPPEAAADDGTR